MPHEIYKLLQFDHRVLEYKVELRERREELGYTQQQITDRCGVSKNAISDIELGNYNPSLELLIKLCVVLQCSVYELLDIHDLLKGYDEDRIVHIII